MKKKTIYINLKVISIVLVVIGIIYLIAGITILNLWEYIYAEEWGGVMLGEGIFFIFTACGLIIKQMLPEKKFIICLILGYITSLLGVIVTLIIKLINKNKGKKESTNKYDELEKLQKLKEQGVLTEEEFQAEKEKLLK